MSASGKSALGVLLDGEPMPEADARAFWSRFSAWMDEHKGDLKGFAASEGLASVHPATQQGRAVLVASRSAAQGAYTNAREVKDAKESKGSGVKSGLKAPGSPTGGGRGGGGSSAPQRTDRSDARGHGLNGHGPKGPKK